jgi:predicted phosphodiesterase
MGNRLCVPDLHAPYHHPDTIDFLCDTYAKYRCTQITLLGDELDFHGVSKYIKSPQALNTHQELTQGAAFLNRLNDAFKHRCKYTKPIIVVKGNHNERVESAAEQVGLTLQMLKSIKWSYRLPSNWFWRDRYKKNGVTFSHGTQFGGVHTPTQILLNALSNVVYGHFHAEAGIRYLHLALAGKTLWSMNCGCLVDENAAVFNYGKRSKYRGVLGCGVIYDGFPIFVPLR